MDELIWNKQAQVYFVYMPKDANAAQKKTSGKLTKANAAGTKVNAAATRQNVTGRIIKAARSRKHIAIQ